VLAFVLALVVRATMRGLSTFLFVSERVSNFFAI
jgi:hypothetical protein